MPEISLKPVDQVEILSIMDNSLDVLMASTPIAQRASRLVDSFLPASAQSRARGSHAYDDLLGRKEG